MGLTSLFRVRKRVNTLHKEIDMVKLVMIGAGSHVFTAKLVGDFLSWPELRDGTIVLVDIDEERLDLVKAHTMKLVGQNDFKTDVESTSDRRKALEGADYIILSIRVGGLETTRLDISIPAKYGIYQGIGDTVGPGGGSFMVSATSPSSSRSAGTLRRSVRILSFSTTPTLWR